MSVFFADEPVNDFAGAQAAETVRYRPFFHAMLDAGVYLPPSAFEAWFVNAAMDETVFDRIAAALPAAARAAGTADAGRTAGCKSVPMPDRPQPPARPTDPVTARRCGSSPRTRHVALALTCPTVGRFHSQASRSRAVPLTRKSGSPRRRP